MVQQCEAAYIFHQGWLGIGAHATRHVDGFPITIYKSIVPTTKTTPFVIATHPDPVRAPRPVLFLPLEAMEFIGMQLIGYDHVFWMGPDYDSSDDFRAACDLLRDIHDATDEQLADLFIAINTPTHFDMSD